MIFDTIENANFYYGLSPHIKTGLLFLQNSDRLTNLPIGRIDIDEEKVFALVQEYETKDFNIDMWEAHRKYYDIQFMVQGQELISLARIEDINANMDYMKEGDYQLFSGNGGSLLLKDNDFIILSPKDVHQPGLIVKSPKRVKKIVVKALI